MLSLEHQIVHKALSSLPTCSFVQHWTFGGGTRDGPPQDPAAARWPQAGCPKIRRRTARAEAWPSPPPPPLCQAPGDGSRDRCPSTHSAQRWCLLELDCFSLRAARTSKRVVAASADERGGGRGRWRRRRFGRKKEKRGGGREGRVIRARDARPRNAGRLQRIAPGFNATRMILKTWIVGWR